MIDVTGPCEFKVGLGRRFRSDELKSGELLTIGIGMILTVDRKHNFFMSFCARMYGISYYGLFFCVKLSPLGGFFRVAEQKLISNNSEIGLIHERCRKEIIFHRDCHHRIVCIPVQIPDLLYP